MCEFYYFGCFTGVGCNPLFDAMRVNTSLLQLRVNDVGMSDAAVDAVCGAIMVKTK